MELRHMRYFVAVAEERNFRRAAARLHISQPPLSQQIQALEQELGARLFVRDKRSVELTEAGEALLRRARALLELAEDAATEVRQVGRGELGRLVVSFMSAAMIARLPSIFRAFRDAHPGVEVVLRQLAPREQISGLASGHIDLGFLAIAPPGRTILVGTTELSSEPMWEEEQMAVLPLDHPLARKRQIALADLADADFITLPRAPEAGYHDGVVDLCRRAGFEPRVRQEVEQSPGVLALVAAGYGVGVMPVCIRDAWPDLVAYRRLKGRPRVSVAFLWRTANRSPVLAAFRDSVRQGKSVPFYTARP